jgi:hypothetical protein
MMRDVRHMHRLRENAGALFQVASQFNLLEMVSSDVAPEDGVTRYQSDPTQGPACAIAAGAATIYRNYFAAIEGSEDQTAGRQFEGSPWRRLEQCHGSARRRTLDNAKRLRAGQSNGTRCHRPASRNLPADQIDVLRERLRIGTVLNAQRGVSNVVFLTLLGGGAFGNRGRWIDAAMRRALGLMTTFDLDVRLVSYGTPPQELLAIAKEFR